MSRFRAAIKTSFSPMPVLMGMVAGFLACCVAGRVAARRPMFEHFLRFTYPIQPERFFYPTASELVTYLEKQAGRGRPLALVGGASYFRGTGQNPNELWSLRLAEDLGNRYTVVNFATDGAGLPSFAGVAFKVMGLRHPDMIYIGNGSPISGEDPDGNNTYRYIFWDAYYKGLLPKSVTQSPAIREARRRELATRDGLEMHLGKWIDRWAYACDLWTYVGYKYFFTVWTPGTESSPWKARREYLEGSDPHLRERQLKARADKAYGASAEAGNLINARSGYNPRSDGSWVADPSAWAGRMENWEGMFPPELRSRCYIVLLRANPYFTRTTTPEEQRHLETSYRIGQRALEQLGYRVVQFDPDTFVADDFVDAGHMVASGGNKVAAGVAKEILQPKPRAGFSQDVPPGTIGAAYRIHADPEVFGRSLPLLTTGVNGAGDVLFLRWSPDGQLSFGYDHWFDGTRYSEAIAVARGSEHVVEFTVPALDKNVDSALVVKVDGIVRWRVRVPYSSAAAPHIYFGENPIRATTAEIWLDQAEFIRFVRARD